MGDEREARAPTPPPILSDPNPGIARALLHAAYDLIWIVALALTSPWWAVSSLFDRAFARMAAERLARGLPLRPPGESRRQRVLVHGVSVGEIKGAAPLVRALEERHPELEILISSTTNTGLEVARKQYPGRRVARFPLDVSPVVGRFLRELDPCAVVLIELEIWPNFLRQCNRAGVPVAVVNGRITDRSFGRYRRFRTSLPQFNRISLFCVQLEEYAQRFRALSGESARVLVTGNMKADGLRVAAPEAARVSDELRRLLGGRDGQLVIVAGSTHHPEERLVAQAWRASAPHARLVLVPRHPPRTPDVVKDLEAIGMRPQLLTRLRQRAETPDPARPAVVDTIGELEAIYSLADLVYVGGSLVPHGGQNVLEPAALGRPVIHGPHVDNFRQEATLLERAGASVQVEDARALERELARLANDEAARERMSRAGLEAVAAQRGATRLTLEALDERCLARVLGPRD